MNTTKPRPCTCCGHTITRSRYYSYHEACVATINAAAARGHFLRSIRVPADIARAAECACGRSVLLMFGRN